VLKQCPTRTVACHHSDTADTDTWPIRDVSGDLAFEGPGYTKEHFRSLVAEHTVTYLVFN
jgi:hypothetical protein